jgi:hypothetical protein
MFFSFFLKKIIKKNKSQLTKVGTPLVDDFNEQPGHLCILDVQLGGQIRDADSGVRFEQAQQDLE